MLVRSLAQSYVFAGAGASACALPGHGVPQFDPCTITAIWSSRSPPWGASPTFPSQMPESGCSIRDGRVRWPRPSRRPAPPLPANRAAGRLWVRRLAIAMALEAFLGQQRTDLGLEACRRPRLPPMCHRPRQLRLADPGTKRTSHRRAQAAHVWAAGDDHGWEDSGGVLDHRRLATLDRRQFVARLRPRIRWKRGLPS